MTGDRSLLALARKKLMPSEKTVETWCDDLAKQLGYEVIRFSQPRNTMQTAGIPDRLYCHPGRKHAVWMEVKRPGGKQRLAQRWFQLVVEACGHEYVCGGVDELRAALTPSAARGAR